MAFRNVLSHKKPVFAEIPCFFPQNREIAFGDEFAADCLHSQNLTN